MPSERIIGKTPKLYSSKSAIIALIIAIIYLFFHLKGLLKYIFKNYLKCLKNSLLISLFFIFLIISINPDFQSFFINSLKERILYLTVSRETILSSPLFGLGIGQFVINMENIVNIRLEIWQFQPVHNVFLLIWSELGIIGLFIFIYFLWKLFHVKHAPGYPRGDRGFSPCLRCSFSICPPFPPALLG